MSTELIFWQVFSTALLNFFAPWVAVGVFIFLNIRIANLKNKLAQMDGRNTILNIALQSSTGHLADANRGADRMRKYSLHYYTGLCRIRYELSRRSLGVCACRLTSELADSSLVDRKP